MRKTIKESFFVKRKEEITSNGDGFIQRVWAVANSHFE